ncbi:MAG: carboxymuconolactone decarboxylase family protein [Spirochaetota bacterium]
MIEIIRETAGLLDVKTKELIAIGASIAGNCMPCLRYHFAEAVKAGCSLDEIAEAAQIAKRVKERPIADIYKLSEELLRKEREKGEADNADV